jgi:hypothetical protein
MTLVVGNRICGLVDASGPAGCSDGSSDNWSLVFHLAAHRVAEKLETTTLRCEIPMSRPDMREWMSRIDAYAFVDATVTGLTEQGAALLSDLKIVDDSDSELAAIKEAMLVPVMVQTDLFGAIELDRNIDQYQGSMTWCGAPVRLSISCADLANPIAAVEVAESLFRAQKDWQGRVQEFAADRLLALKNDSWLGDDEEKLSREVFVSRMTLEEISVDENGDFSFWHDDGDLFWGHAIMISGNLESGLSDADIPG